MKKRMMSFVVLLSIIYLFCSCGTEKETFSLESLKGNRFAFASGTGAWGTEFLVGENGTFKGTYHDSDMGSTGPEYPNGTRYHSSFSGKFTEPEKVNDYTYKMTIESIVYEDEVAGVEIVDEILYKYSNAYGLAGAEEILIYLPGAPIEELPEEYMIWAKGSSYIEEGTTKLPFYGLYNVTEGYGFSSFDNTEFLKNRVASTEEAAREIENSIQNDALTQLDYNMKTQTLYEMWDSDLNVIWSDLKVLLDEETFDTLLSEQREWITTKEAEVKKAGADYEGGSMQPMVMNLKAAELTKTRVYELLEYFE